MKITITDVEKRYGDVVALDGPSFTIPSGSTFGVLGTNGAGKTTLFELLVGHDRPDAGTIDVGGLDVEDAGHRVRERVAFLPEHAGFPAALTGREVLDVHARMRGLDAGDDRIDDTLETVGLADAADRAVSGYSNGMGRRLGLAAALLGEPPVLVLDEPTAALDVSVQATILNLLAELQADLDLAYLFISHDLGVVRHVADRVAVMYLGTLVEVGPARRTLSSPAHPYTQTLLDSTPGEGFDAGSIAAETQDTLAGEPPSPTDPPSGCAFHPRCPAATEECARREPALESVGEARSRCLYADELADAERTGLEATAKSDIVGTEFDRSDELPVERPAHNTD